MSVPTALSLGRSGELHVMSEFLFRGYNVATTQIDVGHDLIAIQDIVRVGLRGEDGSIPYERLWPIQVKTTSKQKRKGSDYVARYGLQLDLLYMDRSPDVTYFFLTRFSDGWGEPIIIPRSLLCESHKQGSLGNQDTTRKKIELRFRHRAGRVRCFEQDLTPYINDWGVWPELETEDKRLRWSKEVSVET